MGMLLGMKATMKFRIARHAFRASKGNWASDIKHVKSFRSCREKAKMRLNGFTGAVLQEKKTENERATVYERQKKKETRPSGNSAQTSDGCGEKTIPKRGPAEEQKRSPDDGWNHSLELCRC